MTALKPPPGVNGRTKDCFGRRWRQREEAVQIGLAALLPLLGAPHELLPAGHVFEDGSGPLENTQAEWRDVPTIYGPLDHVVLDDFGFMTQFRDVPDPVIHHPDRIEFTRTDKPFPHDANRRNGKWNHHFAEADAAAVTRAFVARLAEIIPARAAA